MGLLSGPRLSPTDYVAGTGTPGGATTGGPFMLPCMKPAGRVKSPRDSSV
jgi:hypothetical protein